MTKLIIYKEEYKIIKKYQMNKIEYHSISIT